jgi:hypothetical protein
VVSQPNGSVLSPYCAEHARMAYQPVMSRTSGRPLPLNRVGKAIGSGAPELLAAAGSRG